MNICVEKERKGGGENNYFATLLLILQPYDLHILQTIYILKWMVSSTTPLKEIVSREFDKL